MEDDILLQILKEDPDIEDADESLREKYQDRIKAERDRRSQMIFAERQGEKRGLERGLEQGREQGRQEGRREFILRLKARGMPTAEIADLTGLSPGEIDATV